jgi:hypothetical protein
MKDGRPAPPLGQPTMALAINSLPPLPSKLAPQHIFTSLLSRIRVFDLLASQILFRVEKIRGKELGEFVRKGEKLWV